MDPKQTVRLWIDGDTDATNNYREWVARGGFRVRVELAPWLDAWMQGDRYGDIISLGRKYAHIRMDRSGKTRKIARDSFTLN